MFPLLLLVAYYLLLVCETAFKDGIFWNATATHSVSLEDCLFHASVWQATDCARLCSHHDTCLAFTSIEEACQGYSKVTVSQNSSQLVTGEAFFVRKHSADQVRCQSAEVQTLVEPRLGLIKDVVCDDSWIVILRRENGDVDFYRDWQQYVAGFGNLEGDFWFGLEDLHKLTSIRSYELMVTLEDWDQQVYNATFANFSLSSATDYYSLHVDFVQGTANDSLTYHNGQPFTTYDRDNDIHTKKNCAVKLQGAWWYKKCAESNLCGLYKNSSQAPLKDGITWKSLHGTNYSLMAAEMKIRPV